VGIGWGTHSDDTKKRREWLFVHLRICKCSSATKPRRQEKKRKRCHPSTPVPNCSSAYLFGLKKTQPHITPTLPHKCGASSFFHFFHTPQRPAKSKRELSLDHLQHPIACCGPNQGEIDIFPSRILLRLLRDTLLLPIRCAAPALGPSCC
jgi:hypothetical protein